MRNLSKSKIIAYRQCPKRLWLEIHRPELRDDSRSEHAFAIGYEVGDMAQEVFNTDGSGVLIDIHDIGWPEAFARSAKLLTEGKHIVFEAAMKSGGALALADVMIPSTHSVDGEPAWDMIEVKAATGVKDYYRDDIAVQSYIATSSGVTLSSVSLAHINNSFVYQGDGDYQDLFTCADLTREALSRHDEVRDWLSGAHDIAGQEQEPGICTGAQCRQPFECPFLAHCMAQEPQPDTPYTCLPGLRQDKIEELRLQGITELRDVPDDMLNPTQILVKEHTLAGTTYLDAQGAADELAQASVPGAPDYFLDFETANMPVPKWKGTRPYQQIPFQFSLHTRQPDGSLDQQTFLDLSGDDPRRAFSEALVKACGTAGPIYVFNAGFEKTVMRKQAEAFPELADQLDAIIERVVDLHPITKRHYYHPSQKGSWSIKAVLPAICPDLHYGELEGVQDGNMAISAYREAIAPKTTPERKAEIHQQLDAYCALDTLALARIWEFFAGKRDTV